MFRVKVMSSGAKREAFRGNECRLLLVPDA
jgi:hypothetical protein